MLKILSATVATTGLLGGDDDGADGGGADGGAPEKFAEDFLAQCRPGAKDAHSSRAARPLHAPGKLGAGSGDPAPHTASFKSVTRREKENGRDEGGLRNHDADDEHDDDEDDEEEMDEDAAVRPEARRPGTAPMRGP